VDGTDGVDAFEDVEIPMPYDGWEGAFTDNSPSAGYVSWTTFKVKYMGNSYTVAAGNSNRAFLYWNSATPTQLTATNTKAETIGYGKWIVCNNQGGTAYPSSFIKILGAGHIKANTIEADHIVANAITTAKLNTAAVETEKIAEGAATSTKGAYTAGELTFTTSDTVVQTASNFVSSGGVARIMFQADIKSNDVDTVVITVKRGSTVLFSFNQGATTTYVTRVYSFLDQPGSGTFTYTFVVKGASYSGKVQKRFLSVQEALR